MIIINNQSRHVIGIEEKIVFSLTNLMLKLLKKIILIVDYFKALPACKKEKDTKVIVEE